MIRRALRMMHVFAMQMLSNREQPPVWQWSCN